MFTIPGSIKRDPVRRWALPDRIFFACGACSILAYAFIMRNPGQGIRALWIKPATGFTGNHIVAVRGDRAFDYHGFSSWTALLAHTRAKARRWWPGWSCSIVALPENVLISAPGCQSFDGLRLMPPGGYLHDPLPRAERFIDRFVGQMERTRA